MNEIPVHFIMMLIFLVLAVLTFNLKTLRGRQIFWFSSGGIIMLSSQHEAVTFVANIIGLSSQWLAYLILLILLILRRNSSRKPLISGNKYSFEFLDVLFGCFLLTILLTALPFSDYKEVGLRLLSWSLIYIVGAKFLVKEITQDEYFHEQAFFVKYFMMGIACSWLFVLLIVLFIQGPDFISAQTGASIDFLSFHEANIGDVRFLTAANPNTIGTNICFSGIVFLGIASGIHKKKLRRIIYLLVFFISQYIALLSYARGAIISFWVSLLITYIFCFKSRKILICLYLILFVFLFFGADIYEYVRSFFDRTNESLNLSQIIYQARLGSTYSTLSILYEEVGLLGILVGIGPNISRFISTPSDNGWILMVVISGIFGLITFLMIVFRGVRLSYIVARERMEKKRENLFYLLNILVFFCVLNFNSLVLAFPLWSALVFLFVTSYCNSILNLIFWKQYRNYSISFE